MSKTDRTIDRRKALKQIAVGGAVIATIKPGDTLAGTHRHVHVASPASAAAPPWTPSFFNSHQNETVAILAELIIPATDTPGARAAKVNEFIDLMLGHEEAAAKREFIRGLEWIDRKSRELYGVNFKDSSSEQQNALLVTLASEKKTAPEDQPGVEFFNSIKGYTISGYYTSEIGLIKELGYTGNSYLAEFSGCTHPEHQK